MLERIAICLCLLAATPVAAQGTPELYAGEARIGSDEPIPVHLEIRRSDDAVEGVFTTQSGPLSLARARGREAVEADLVEDGAAVGSVALRFEGDAVEGTFTFAGQQGTLRLQRTDADAASFLQPPRQSSDLTAAQWLEDLDALVRILSERHGAPFHRTSRELFLAEAGKVRAAIPQLAPEEIVVEFRRLAALIGDGHTSVAALAGRPLLPIVSYWFEDGLRVTLAPPGMEELLGARLLAIDGVPIAEATDRLRAFIGQGETEWAYRGSAPALIRNPAILGRAGIGSGPTRRFALETVAGEVREVALTATAEEVQWVRLGGDRPLWQRHSDSAFRVERLPGGAVYVNWRSYEGLRENAASLLRQLDRERPAALLIDLRSNTGGDFNRGRAFVREIARRPWLNRKGRLFVLTGRSTFSAAMTNAVDFKTTTEATLIGEPPGAAPNNWQESRSFHLPNSGLRVTVSTRYYSFLPGADAVHPDIHVPPHPDDWGSPHDAAVRYILERLQGVDGEAR